MRRAWTCAFVATLLLFVSLIRTSEAAPPKDPDELLKKVEKDLQDEDGQRRAVALKNLAELDEPRFLPLIIKYLGDPHPKGPHERVMDTAVNVLVGYKAEPGVVGEAVTGPVGFRNPNPEIRARAARVVGLRGWKGGADKLLVALADGDNRRFPAVRADCALALGRLKLEGEQGAKVLETLKKTAASDADWQPKSYAVEAVSVMEGAASRDWLAEQASGGSDKRVRLHALRLLAGIDAEASVAAAIARLKDADWEVQVTACEVLRKHRRKDSVEPLIDALAAADGRIRWDLAQSLAKLTGFNLGIEAEKWRNWWRFRKDAFELPADGVDAEIRTTAGFYGIPLLTKRPIFVLDLSGGMAREVQVDGKNLVRANVAKEELKKALVGLQEGSQFNVIFFGTDVSALNERGMIPNARSNLAQAAQFIDRKLPQGRTNMYDAIEFALSMSDGDTIFLLTEGGPNEGTFQNKGEILSKIEELNQFRKVQIHVVQVAEPAKSWRNFTEPMSAATGGMVVKKY